MSSLADFAARLKRALASDFPAIKSSHLTEAIARGLGFSTHAALLTLSKTDGVSYLVSGTAFSMFLHARGHDVEPTIFVEAAARAREPAPAEEGE